MNREEIIRMALDAGVIESMPAEGEYPAVWTASTPELERFAALVEERTLTKQKARHYQEGYDAGAAAEREACAKVCDTLMHKENPYDRWEGMKWCADAIRARGQA